MADTLFEHTPSLLQVPEARKTIYKIPKTIDLVNRCNLNQLSKFEALPIEILLQVFLKTDILGRVALTVTSKHFARLFLSYSTNVLELDPARPLTQHLVTCDGFNPFYISCNGESYNKYHSYDIYIINPGLCCRICGWKQPFLTAPALQLHRNLPRSVVIRYLRLGMQRPPYHSGIPLSTVTVHLHGDVRGVKYTAGMVELVQYGVAVMKDRFIKDFIESTPAPRLRTNKPQS